MLGDANLDARKVPEDAIEGIGWMVGALDSGEANAMAILGELMLAGDEDWPAALLIGEDRVLGAMPGSLSMLLLFPVCRSGLNLTQSDAASQCGFGYNGNRLMVGVNLLMSWSSRWHAV